MEPLEGMLIDRQQPDFVHYLRREEMTRHLAVHPVRRVEAPTIDRNTHPAS
jgi:hypothetical protein